MQRACGWQAHRSSVPGLLSAPGTLALQLLPHCEPLCPHPWRQLHMLLPRCTAPYKGSMLLHSLYVFMHWPTPKTRWTRTKSPTLLHSHSPTNTTLCTRMKIQRTLTPQPCQGGLAPATRQCPGTTFPCIGTWLHHSHTPLARRLLGTTNFTSPEAESASSTRTASAAPPPRYVVLQHGTTFSQATRHRPIQPKRHSSTDH